MSNLNDVVTNAGKKLLAAKKKSRTGKDQEAYLMALNAVMEFGPAVAPYIPQEEKGMHSYSISLQRFGARLESFFFEEWRGNDKKTKYRKEVPPNKGVFATSGVERGKNLLIAFTKSLRDAGIPEKIVLDKIITDFRCKGFALNAVKEVYGDEQCSRLASSVQSTSALYDHWHVASDFQQQGWALPWMSADCSFQPADGTYIPDFLPRKTVSSMSLNSLREWRDSSLRLQNVAYRSFNDVWRGLVFLLNREGWNKEAVELATDILTITLPCTVKGTFDEYDQASKERSLTQAFALLDKLVSRGGVIHPESLKKGFYLTSFRESGVLTGTMRKMAANPSIASVNDGSWLEGGVLSVESYLAKLEALGQSSYEFGLKEGVSSWWANVKGCVEKLGKVPATSEQALSLITVCARCNVEIFLLAMDSYGHLLDLKDGKTLSPVIKRRLQRISSARNNQSPNAKDNIEDSSLRVIQAMTELGASTSIKADKTVSVAPKIGAVLENIEFKEVVSKSAAPSTPAPRRRI